MTNIERRVQKLNRLIPPCGQAMAEWRIFNELGRALGTDLGYRSSEDVFGEMQRTIPFLSGIDLSDTEGEGVVIRSAADSFRSEPRGKPFAFAPTRPVEKPDSEFATDYPFELMAGRSKYHFGSTTSHSRHITVLCPHHYVEINGADATDLGITEGDEVQVSSPSGTFSAPARITSALPRGMVFGPVNFPEMGIYNLFQENTTLCRVRLESPGGRRPS
jgi:predicted molibdopterin-dependent oxidoreductase YjgC